MLHLKNDTVNVVTLATQLPSSYVFTLTHKATQRTLAIGASNLINGATRSHITFSDLEAGEYTYKAEANGLTYERGVAKIATVQPTEKKTYTKSNKYKAYVKG